MEIITLTSNPFQVNTYIVIGDNKEAIIIDPGCSSISEKKQCIDEIQKRGLLPKKSSLPMLILIIFLALVIFNSFSKLMFLPIKILHIF
jgi:hypothetical protein